MPSNTPRTNAPAPPSQTARVLACLTFALTLLGAAHAAQAQGPAATPTPYVRPRTVGPKTDAAPPVGEVNEAVDEDEVVRVDSNLVLIPASVFDSRGRAVTDLRLEDFELKVDGEPKLINDLSRAETPVTIALLFDNSKSLSAAREFEKQAALRFFRSVVRPIDRVAIYSFANSPRLETPFTNSVPRLVSTIENFGPPEGATALFDALAQAADYIGPQAGRKVIVLVSDGSDTLSDINFEEVLNRTLRAECQVYVVQTRQIEDPNLHDRFSEELMRKLAEQTGGAVFVPRSIEDLDVAFAQISNDLAQQYVLSYSPQEERRDNYFRFINVSVKARPHLRVRARKGFYPHGEKAGAQPPDAARAPQPKPNGAAQPLRTDANAARPARGGKSQGRAATRSGAAGRVGPDAPDEEERPRAPQPAVQYAEEVKPTLTLSVAEARPAPPARPAPEPAPTPAPPNTAPTPAATPTVTPAAAAPAPTPAPAAAEERETPRQAGAVSGGVLNSKALELPRPDYPPMAKSYGVTGTVVVEVTIDEGGNVAEVRVVSGHPLLQQAALRAARRAKFSPATLSGQPVKVKGTINYNFSK